MIPNMALKIDFFIKRYGYFKFKIEKSKTRTHTENEKNIDFQKNATQPCESK